MGYSGVNDFVLIELSRIEIHGFFYYHGVFQGINRTK